MYYYIFRRDTRYGYYDYIQDFDTMAITESPLTAAQVSRSELNYIDLDYMLSLGFHPVEITAAGIRYFANMLFRPATPRYRPRMAPPPPRRLPAPPPPPRPRPARIPAGRASVRPVSGIGRGPRPMAVGGRAAVPPARPVNPRRPPISPRRAPGGEGPMGGPGAVPGPRGGAPRGGAPRGGGRPMGGPGGGRRF